MSHSAGAADLGDAPPRVLIRPPRGWSALGLAELWEYRELVYFLAWREVKVRYAQTALGVAWAVLQPLLTMVVFTIFFGAMAKVPSDGLPYALFSFAALVPWTFFAQGVTLAANSVVLNQHLVTKVYFPRLAIPLAIVLSGVLDLAIAFAVLLGLMLSYGVPLGARALWTLPLIGLALVTCLGAGLWLSALNVRYRDVRYIVPFVTQTWLLATPIAYPSSLIPEPWRTVYGLNPMAGVVEGFRWALLDSPTRPGPMILLSSVVALLMAISGALYFRRTERTFADVI